MMTNNLFSVENGPSKPQSAESAQAKTQKPKKAKKNDIQILTRPKNAPKSGERRRKVKNTGPPIDPEFLGDINDIRGKSKWLVQIHHLFLIHLT